MARSTKSASSLGWKWGGIPTLTLVALIASAAALLSGQWAVAGVVVGVGICSKYPHGVAGFGVYAVAAVAVGGWAAAGLLITGAGAEVSAS